MAASMDFYPGGAEDESDSDDDGFVLGDASYDQKKANNFLQTEHNYTQSTGRGGFGKPPVKHPSSNDTRTTKHQQQQQSRPAVGMDDFRMAILRGNIETATSYIKQGCNVNTVLKGGWTALMYAASSAYPDIVSLLIQKGANPKCHNDMYTALMAACASTTNRADDVLKCVTLLIDNGADVNDHDRYHMTPLIYAAREGREEVVTKLLDAGANINKQDSRGWTSLSWATNKNHIKVVKLLLSKGALNLKHCDGLTALDIAVMQDFQEAIALLGGNSSGKQNVVPAMADSPGDVYHHQNGLSTVDTGILHNDAYGDQGVVKYGELELFLSGLGLRTLVPAFQQHHVDFSTFLQMTDGDLIKMGIQQIGVRKKILDGIQDVHKTEWEKSSINSVHYNKMLRLADSVAMVTNISRHTKFIKSTIGYIQDQIKTSPQILEVQDGTSPLQLHENVQETINNVQLLQDELRRFNTHLTKVLKSRDFDPPDLIKTKKTKKSKVRIKRLIVFSVCLGTVVTVIWKRETIQEIFNSLFVKS